MQTNIKRGLVLASAIAAISIQASAATYDWISGGTWITADWSTLDGGAYPDGVGDIANLTVDIGANQGLNLPAAGVTVGGVTLADPDGSHAYTIGSGALTFETATGNAYIITGGTGTVTNNINSPTTLNSNLAIQLGTQAFSTSGAWTMNGHQVVITGGRHQASAWTVQAGNALSGDGTIVNSSLGGIIINGTKAFTGTFVLNSGVGGTSNNLSLTTTSGSVQNAAEIIVNGYVVEGYGLNVVGGGYHQGSGSSFTTNPGQRTTLHRVTLNGGQYNMAGNGATAAVGNDWQEGNEYVSDTTANVHFAKGYTLMNTTAGTNTLGTRWHIGTVERDQGATAYVRSGQLGTTARFLAGNGATLGIGGGGAAGTPTMNVVPWLVAANANLFSQNGDLATYDTTVVGDHVVGFRALSQSTEMTSDINAGSFANLNSSNFGAMGEGVTTINALRHNGSSVTSIAAGKTLRIQSGAVVFANNGGGLGAPGVGTVDFGAAEAVIWSFGSQSNAANPPTIATNYIGATITGTGGLTKAGTGLLVLRGPNEYSGRTTVAAGTLQVGDGANISLLGSGDVYVGIGATLRLMNDAAIDDLATVFLEQYGLATSAGRVDIAANIIEEVNGLALGGIFQDAGFYGSSVAAAANPTLGVIVNDLHFAGSGVLQVVPEPGTATLAGLAVAGFFLRRRRA